LTSFRSALDALEHESIPFHLRKLDGSHELPSGGELDLWLAPSDLRRADAALRSAGFHHLEAPGHPGHRFYVAFDGRRWLKLDAKMPGRAGRLDRLGAAWNRRRPAALRRLGPVVAVLGPDGAGKGSLVSALRARIPFAVTPVYLGYAGRRPPRRRAGLSGSERPVPAWREVAGVFRGAIRAWRILLRAYAAAWRGHVVLCDRHPIEVLAVRPRRSRAAALVERLLVQHLTPRPDAIVLLDAPGRVLFRRKGEHSVEVLERWRRGYAEEFEPRGAVTISTMGRKEASLHRASEVVWAALRKRRRW
jgi:thymidylate kinase